MVGPFFPRAHIPQQRGSRCQSHLGGSVVDEDDEEQLIVLEEVLHKNLGGFDCPYKKEERIFRRTGRRKDCYHATRRRRRRPPAELALIFVATAAAFLVISISAGKNNFIYNLFKILKCSDGFVSTYSILFYRHDWLK